MYISIAYTIGDFKVSKSGKTQNDYEFSQKSPCFRNAIQDANSNKQYFNKKIEASSAFSGIHSTLVTRNESQSKISHPFKNQQSKILVLKFTLPCSMSLQKSTIKNPCS
jgi:hypothetical protein